MNATAMPFRLLSRARLAAAVLGGLSTGLGLVTLLLLMPLGHGSALAAPAVVGIQGAALGWIWWTSRRQSRALAAKTKQLAATKSILDYESTRRLKSESELHGKDTLLRLITTSLPVAIAYVDASERYLFCNQVYAQWYCLPRNEIIGSTARAVVGEEIYDMMHAGLVRVMAGETVVIEAKVPYRDRARFVRIHKIPDVDADGRTSGFVILSADISEQIQYQEDLIRAKEDADAANLAKSAFLANMSHEIRTPLGAILGFSEFLTGPPATQAERTTWVSSIKRNSELLSNIINDILDLSKVEAGKFDVEKQEISLSEVLTDVTTFLNLKALEKGVKLTISSEGAVPTTINTDALRLRQVLLNVVGNAIKFTERGSIDVKIKLLVAGDDAGKLAFIVRDTGVGISAHQKFSLFEPFVQADVTTKRKFGGTGLGLTLAKRLAVLLGGDVALSESVPGKGSTFIVTIDPGQVQRILFESFGAGALEKPVREGMVPEIRLDGMKVLLVEDSQDNRVLVSRLLKFAGALVDVAEDGQAAIEMAHTSAYDVLLMDVQMPVLDGVEATMALRKEGYRTPIVALTAHAFKEERDRCLAAGFNEHITKPVDRTILLRALARYDRRQTLYVQ